MKKFTAFLNDFFLLQRFQIYGLMLLLVISLSSCFQKYYNTNTVTKTDSATLKTYLSQNKLFIIHAPDGSFELKNVTVTQDLVTGDKASLDPSLDNYLNPKEQGANHLQMNKSVSVLNEVHLYTTKVYSESGKINLNINNIFRMDAYGFDRDATKKSRTASIVGITVAAGAVVGVVAIAANSMDHMFEGMTISMH